MFQSLLNPDPRDVGAARTPRGPHDKEITLDPSEYHRVEEPAGLLEGPRKSIQGPRGVQEAPRLEGPKTDAPKGWTAPVDAVEPPVPDGHMRLYRGVKPEAFGTEFSAPMTMQERKLFGKMLMGDIPHNQWTKEQETFYKKAVESRSFQGGKYFSDNIGTAKDYAGAQGKVIYVDVPNEVAYKNMRDAGALPGADGKINYNATVVTLPSETALTAREHALSPTNPYRIAERQSADIPHARLVGRPASLERAADAEPRAASSEPRAARVEPVVARVEQRVAQGEVKCG